LLWSIFFFMLPLLSNPILSYSLKLVKLAAWCLELGAPESCTGAHGVPVHQT
jgi:hypothetical protein